MSVKVRIIENINENPEVKLSEALQEYNLQCILVADAPIIRDKEGKRIQKPFPHVCLGIFLNEDNDFCFLQLTLPIEGDVESRIFLASSIDEDDAWLIEYLSAFQALFVAAKKWMKNKRVEINS